MVLFAFLWFVLHITFMLKYFYVILLFTLYYANFLLLCVMLENLCLTMLDFIWVSFFFSWKLNYYQIIYVFFLIKFLSRTFHDKNLFLTVRTENSNKAEIFRLVFVNCLYLRSLDFVMNWSALLLFFLVWYALNVACFFLFKF